jgi:YVTN family beta-propeller protein
VRPPDPAAVGTVSGELTAGTEIAGYRIEELVGRGGMGVVYRAHDLALDRNVALKILSPDLAEDERFRERFLRESRLAASLDHPSIVPVFDGGEVRGQLYIAMRYVEGTDLKALLAAEGKLEPARAVGIVEQIADALDAAHERGLIHRDVKPSNVLIDSRGHSYLADFGLSRRLGEAGAALGAAQSLGTVDYVSPEQIRGEELAGRADLYSLGCLLYECLTGKPPFRRDSDAATLFAHLEQAPSAPAGLEKVIEKALAKSPDDRYQTGRELVQAARSALGLEPRPDRRLLALAAVGVALIAAGLAAFFLTRGGGPAAEPGADTLVRIDPRTNRIAERISVGRSASGVAADARHVWVANAGDGTVWRIDPKTRKVLKIAVHATPTGIALRGQFAVVANGAEGTVTVFDTATGASDGVTRLTAAGAATVEVGGGGDQHIWFGVPAAQIVGDGEGELLPTGGASAHVRIPPDLTSLFSAYESFDGLAVGSGAVWVAGDSFGRSVWRIDSSTRKVVATIRLPFAPAAIAAGDGAVWVTSLLGDTVSRIDPATNRVTRTIRVGRGAFAVAAAGGSVWVTGAIDGTVSRLDPATGRLVATIPVGGSPTGIAVGAGGVWIVEAKR